MKTITEYLVNNHVKKRKEIHSYEDLTDGDYYAIEYGENYVYLAMFAKIKDNRTYNYIGFDSDDADDDLDANSVHINTYAMISPLDKVRDVTDEERALLDDIVSQCDLNGKISAKGIVMNGTDSELTIPTGGGYGSITTWEDEKVYDSITAIEAGELNWVNRLGALLWENNLTHKIVADNAGATQYWDPKSTTITTPTKADHTLIAVCVGFGKWAAVSWVV